MHVEEGQLRDFLIDAGLISRSQLEVVMGEANGKRLSQVLVEQGLLSEDEMRRSIASATGVQFVTLQSDDISLDALELIPEALSRARNVIAYRTVENVVQVALLDMRDMDAIEFLHSRMRVVPRLTSRDSMRSALLLYQKHLKKKFGDAIARDVQGIVEPAPGASDELLIYSAERLPVAYVTDSLIRHALNQKASHVHLELRDDGLLVRYRIGAVMHDAMTLPRHAAYPVILRLKLLSNLKLKSTEPQEGRFKIQNGDDSYSVRTSTVPTVVGEKLVLRIVSDVGGHKAFTLESLGFHGDGLEHVHAALLKRKGLVLVCGPEGSGKTTTLYTMLDLVNSPHLSIATVEGSIEISLPYASQTRVDNEIGLTQSVTLRAALRLDPDVVMISEIHDKDTALLALQAANNGKLILAGLIADNAVLGIEKLKEFSSKESIAGTLSLIVACRVVKRLCAKCREEYKISRAESHLLEDKADFAQVLAALKEEKIIDKQTHWKAVKFARAEGCKECDGGYKGVLGVQEVMSISSTVARLISEDDIEAVESQARKEGMLTLIEDGLFKAAQHQTSIDEVLQI